jgi:aspartate aminotransferase
MSTLQSQTTSCTSSLCQLAAEGAMLGPQDGVGELRACMQRNRDVILAELSKIPGVAVAKPAGTFYCLPDFSAFLGRGVAGDSFELAMFLLEKARVVTVPGRDFGVEGHLRLSYAGTAEDAVEGVTRIRWALDPSTPKSISIGGRTVVRDWL